MEKYLEKAIQVAEARKKAARNNDKAEVRKLEMELAAIFKEAKANGVDTGKMNDRLINSTISL